MAPRKRWTVLLAATAMLTLTSCASTAAQLSINGTAPLRGNDGSCGAPAFVPFEPGVMLMIRTTWAGPVSGSDSVLVAPGMPFSFLKTVPPGTYTITASARNGAFVGCDTTITRVVKAVPDKPGLN